MYNMAKFKLKFKHVVIGAVAVAGVAKVASMMLEDRRRRDRALNYLEGEQRLRERAMDLSSRSPGTHLFRVRYRPVLGGREMPVQSSVITATSGDMAARIVENKCYSTNYDYYSILSVEQLG